MGIQRIVSRFTMWLFPTFSQKLSWASPCPWAIIERTWTNSPQLWGYVLLSPEMPVWQQPAPAKATSQSMTSLCWGIKPGIVSKLHHPHVMAAAPGHKPLDHLMESRHHRHKAAHVGETLSHPVISITENHWQLTNEVTSPHNWTVPWWRGLAAKSSGQWQN